MLRRAERMLDETEGERQRDRVASLRFPKPAPCGKTPLMAQGLSKSYGSLEIFTDVGLAIDRGSRVVVLGLNGAGKTTLLRLLAGVDDPDTGEIQPRSEEHTSELQSRGHLVCRLLLEKKKTTTTNTHSHSAISPYQTSG